MKGAFLCLDGLVMFTAGHNWQLSHVFDLAGRLSHFITANPFHPLI